MMTAFALAGLTFTGSYWFLRLVVWRENQAMARLDQVETLAPEVEASPRARTTIITKNGDYDFFTGE